MYHENDYLINAIDYQSSSFDSIIPDISLKKPEITNSLEVRISNEDNLYKLINEEGQYLLSNGQLDIDLDNFSTKNKYININESLKLLPWNEQNNFIGSNGNDIFNISKDPNNTKISSKFNSSPGNDIYKGSLSTIDLVNYSNLEDFNIDNLGYKVDHISGLQIFDKYNYEELNVDNSPLLEYEIYNDPLIINKGDIFTNVDIDQIDILEEIEVARFTTNDDTFYANKLNSKNIYDFISGDDKLIFCSSEFPRSLANILSLDKFIWKRSSDSEEKVEFEVNYLKEDEYKPILIENYDSNNFENKLISDYVLEIFNDESNDNQQINWLDFSLISPTPELINQGNPVIEKKFLRDPEDKDLYWLEIHIYDYRTHGKGFLGAEIDLEWDNNISKFDNNFYNLENVFGLDKLPIFQELGEIKFADNSDNLSSINGISAGSLPVASQGVILGDVNSDSIYTNFARFPFRNIDLDNPPEIKLTLKSLPASKALTVNNDNVIIIDQNSPKALVLEGLPSQQNIGTHFIKVSSTSDQNLVDKNFVINVESINDTPVALNFENEIDNPLKGVVKQDEVYRQDLSNLFTDEDDIELSYEIVSAPNWLSLVDDKFISGSPGNIDVGIHSVIVSATDGQNDHVFQELEINVLNINDAPEIVNSITLPTVEQDVNFSYSLTSNSFFDKDTLVNPEERLTYELIVENGKDDLVKILSIDKITGNISIKTDYSTVGTTNFSVKATDSDGLSVVQSSTLNVLNVNDSPFLTENIPDFQNPISLDLGDQASFEIDKWFNDYDLGFDQNEILNFQIWEDDGSGTLKSISYDPQNWLSFEKENNLLTINPVGQNIGNNYILITATDKEGLQASATVPVKVKYRNNNPTLNFKDENLLKQNIKSEGIENIETESKNNQNGFIDTLTFLLDEQSEFNLELPFNIFKDQDIGVDPNEKLTFKLLVNGVEIEKNELFEFNPGSLKFKGNTTDLGLNSIGGNKEYTSQLIITDNYGLKESIDLIFKLQRSLELPNIIVNSENLEVNEGGMIALSEFFDFKHNPVNGENLTFIFNEISEFDRISIVNDQGQVKAKDTTNQENNYWSFSGNYSEIISFLDSHYIKSINLFDKGDFSIGLKVQSSLGETNLQKESPLYQKNFSINPIPNLPSWKFNDLEIKLLNSFQENILENLFHASSPDLNEEIFYLVNLPIDRNDLIITNRQFNKIGTITNSGILLTSEEWKSSIIRTNKSIFDEFEISLSAISKEINGKEIQTPIRYQRILPTAFIDEDPVIDSQSPEGVQNSGQTSKLSVFHDFSEASKSLIYSVTLPNGASVERIGSLENPIPENIIELDNNRTKFQFIFDSTSVDFTEQVDFFIKTDESYNGKLEGQISLLSSCRKKEDISFENNFSEDLLNQFAKQSTPNNFSWDVIQVAALPEFSENLGFDPKTGKLSVGIRRGSSSNGYRNPNEAISLSVSNIPSGYSLAERINGEFKSIGAKDKFGTIALFNIPKFDGTNLDEINNFDFVNNDNLFLVAKEDDPIPLDENMTLGISISSLISGQLGGDSRSKINRSEINLNSFLDSSDTPVLSKGFLTIDPLIIDFSEDNLDLTSIEENIDIKFEMLPESEPLNTGWISSKNNENSNQSAFLALNSDLNDVNGTIQINSITELFSEYFQSSTGKRTYLTGVEALKSLDSDENLILNNNDLSWMDILLWFDDGDAKTDFNEIFKLNDYVSSIDLNSYKVYERQPTWNSGNQIIGRINATDKDGLDIYDIYDVGLIVNPSELSSIDIQIDNNSDENDFINLKENGNSIKFSIKSPDSSSWIEDGNDELTLIRLSGLPSEIKPSLGVKDSRGDWLFTWSDLNKNGGELFLFPPAFWSGNSNLNFLVSQLQSDGSLTNSPIISYGLNVESVPTKPIFRVQDKSIEEDESIKLIDMVSIAKLIDTDGSELLYIEIEDKNDFYIYENSSDNRRSKIKSDDGKYKFTLEQLSELYISAKENFSGQINLNWKAVATEISSNQTAETLGNNILFLNSVADNPLPIDRKNNDESLIEGLEIPLSKIINVSDFNAGLVDTDGSEEIRYELEIPNGINLRNFNNLNWSPLSNTSSNNKNIFKIISLDLPNLELYDDGFLNDLFEISITRISREILNGNEAKSTKTIVQLPFHKNAQPAKTVFKKPQIEEDSDGIELVNLFEITPNIQTDKLIYKLNNINSNLEIYNLNKNEIYSSNTPALEFEDLNNLFLRPKPNISGNFSFDFSVKSIPIGKGKPIETDLLNCVVNINPIADIPEIVVQNPTNEKIEINDNGWVNIRDLGLSVVSNDKDLSEDFSLIINAINQNNEIIPLPNQVIFNTPFNSLENNQIEIKNAHLQNLSIYLDEITDDLNLQFTPKSIDGDSISFGKKKEFTIKANLEKIIVKVPLLQVSGSIQGYEDVPIPLLSNIGGVVSAQHRDKGIGQTLFLEVNNLPENSKIIKLISQENEENKYSSPLNFDEQGNLNSYLRLPYEKWEDLYVSMPENLNGEFIFNVKAISVGDEVFDERSTQNILVRTILTPVNDAPLIANFDDLEKANEGEIFRWNIRNRFIDFDNDLDELLISAKFRNGSGEFDSLPSWLNLDSKGILTSEAKNEHVGIYTLRFKAVDPLGGEIQQDVKLEIGNINQKPFLLNTPSGWNDISEEGLRIFKNTINLNDSKLLNLDFMFDDIDLVYGDNLFYQISKDGVTWDKNIENLGLITNRMLIVKPLSKEMIGNHEIFLRAVDKFGASSTIKLSIDVLNVNEPPKVNRLEATQISNYLWEEEIEIIPDKTDFNLDLTNLFVDPDLADIIEEIYPVLPSWLTLETEIGKTGGILKGKPTINDIGEEILDFNAYDQSGKIITFRLKINVQNINDPPVIINNPDLSSLGEVIDGIPNVIQNSYSTLDPSILFYDEDFPYGDSLSYEINDVVKVDNENEISLENPDWINLSYKTSSKPDSEGKFLIEPILFIEDENGELTKKVEINDLASLKENTRILVLVNATDKRKDDSKGLVGLDLDVTVSKSLDIINQSVNISQELPLFNKIIYQRNGFRVEAGSAPDLGIGGSVGDIQNETLFSFETILKSPDLKVSVSLTPGLGDFRDGLTTRNAVILASNNSVIHSITNQDGADLEILAPSNQNVGMHKIYIKATDQSGESIVGDFFLNIKNLNEAPTLNQLGINRINELLNNKVIEGDLIKSEIINLFDDPDFIHGDNINLKLFFEDNNYFEEFGNSLQSIALQSDAKGNVKIKLEPPRGLTKAINPKFTIRGMDEDGLNVFSPIFNIDFIPKSELTLLTTGQEKNRLQENNLGIPINKNILIDLGNALNLNAPELNDPDGDELFINLIVKSTNSQITFNGFEANSFVSSVKHDEGSIHHAINITKLKEENIQGNLRGAILSIDPNTFSNFPTELKSNYKYGIPIEIWTSTRVLDDSSNEFGFKESPKSKFWIPVINSNPLFLPGQPLNIKNSISQDFFEKALFNISDNFLDLDPDDELSLEIKIPSELIEVLKFKENTGEIIFQDHIKHFDQLPIGNHRIKILAKDSSFERGDNSAKVKGLLRINVVDNSNTEEVLNGLNLINRLAPNDIKAIFKRFDSNQTLLSEENDLVRVFQKLNRNETNREILIDKISNGSAAILNNFERDKPLVLLDSLAEDELVLLDAKQEEIDQDFISSSQELLEAENYLDSPLGKLEFTIETSDDIGAYVDLYLEDGGVNINELVKTNLLDESFIFKSQKINYDSEKNDDFETWLKDLKYQVYSYPNNILVNSISRSEDINSLDVSQYNLNDLDGSSYLIDKNNDGTIDVISMLLLDQGFFDTNTELNTIGDPLIPIQTLVDDAVIVNSSNISLNTNLEDDQISSQKQSFSLNMQLPISSEFSSTNKFNQFELDSIKKKSDPDDSFGSFKVKEINILNKFKNSFSNTNPISLLNKFKNNLNELKDLVDSYFEESNNKQFLSILGVLFLPILGERIFTPIAKQINLNYELNLVRRNNLFSGKWLFETSTGNKYTIKRIPNKLEVAKIIGKTDFNDFEYIKGFNLKKESLLFRAFLLSSKPGIFIDELQRIQKEFIDISSLETNWESWLNKSLINYIDHGVNFNKAIIRRLTVLIRETNKNDPCETDMMMLAHIIDCCENLNLPKLFGKN